MTDCQERQRFETFSRLIEENNRIMFAGKLLQKATERFGSNAALIFKDQTVSYDQLYKRSLAFTQKLQQQGLKPHDRVLLYFENSVEFYIAYFGVWQAGAVVAPLNFFLKEVELAHIVKDSRAAFIICASDKTNLFAGHTVPVLTELDMPAITDNDLLPDVTIPANDPDAMAALLYTSGTTGLPKGVMLSSRNIMSNIVQGMARIPLDFGQRVFAILPLFHSFAQLACVWGSLFTGCTVILVPKIERRYLLEGLKHKPTVFLGVPALYGILCLLKNAPLQSVKYFVSGGDALPDKIRMGFELIYRRKLCNGYGLTETTPVIAAELDDVLEPTNTVGKPMLGVSCSIRDEQGNELPQGAIGVLWVKGPNVMLGYYRAPEATAKILQNGWLNTGDFAVINEDGKIIICGRDKDLIAHKGIKIYPQEIENVIMSHPAVIHAGVVGREDESSGQVPVAFVQLREKVPTIEAELKELCNQQLATYKVPKAFIIITDMPLTATGKIDKKALRQRLKEQNL